MHGIEHRISEHRAFRLSAPRKAVSPLPGSKLQSQPQPLLLSSMGPFARNGLSLASNGFHFRGFHYRVTAPGLLLRFQRYRSQARSAFRSTAGRGSLRFRLLHRFGPLPVYGHALQALPPASTPLWDFYLPPDQSVLLASGLVAHLPDSPDLLSLPAPCSIASLQERIIVPGPLRFRRLAVPQTSWNLPHYAPVAILRQSVS